MVSNINNIQELFSLLAGRREGRAFEAVEISYVRVGIPDIYSLIKQMKHSFQPWGKLVDRILIIKDRETYVKFSFYLWQWEQNKNFIRNNELRFALYNNIYIVTTTLASQHLFAVTLCQTLY